MEKLKTVNLKEKTHSNLTQIVGKGNCEKKEKIVLFGCY